jgi:hypothetical protein
MHAARARLVATFSRFGLYALYHLHLLERAALVAGVIHGRDKETAPPELRRSSEHLEFVSCPGVQAPLVVQLGSELANGWVEPPGGVEE